MTTPPAPAEVPGKVKAGGKGLAKSLKGHPPWLYAVVIVGAIAVAYMVRKRQNDAAAAAMASSPDTTSTPYGGYGDTANYPGSTQGAYTGSNTPGDEQPQDPPIWATLLPGQISAAIAGSLYPTPSPATVGGGGMPDLPPDSHVVPEIPTPAPAPPAPAPPPPPPVATHSEPQPTMGPGIFYNADRRLRYVIQSKKTTAYPHGHNFRGYESRLNRGDWGGGGWIPQ